jgi:hypothetical protein
MHNSNVHACLGAHVLNMSQHEAIGCAAADGCLNMSCDCRLCGDSRIHAIRFGRHRIVWEADVDDICRALALCRICICTRHENDEQAKSRQSSHNPSAVHLSQCCPLMQLLPSKDNQDTHTNSPTYSYKVICLNASSFMILFIFPASHQLVPALR